MAKKKKVEEKGSAGETGSGRWMLTYLDMITLLFGVFIIMYAMSNVDKGRAEQVAESLRKGFMGGRTIFFGPLTGGQTIMDNLYPIGSDKKHLYEKLSRALTKELQSHLITIKEGERGVSIQLASDIYFQTGSWELSEESAVALKHIAKLLNNTNYYLSIEGHTDDAPIHTLGKERKAGDNWELGALRAISVLRYIAEYGVDPKRMSAVSYSMFKPAIPVSKWGFDSDSLESRALNRRVEIVILTEKGINPEKKR